MEEAPGGWGGLARSKDPAMRALWEAEGRGCLHCVSISLPLAPGEGGEISILQSLGTLIAAVPVGVLWLGICSSPASHS